MKLLLIFLLFCVINNSLAQVEGCTDPLASNFNPNATQNDGSCVYATTSVNVSSSALLPNELSETSGLEIWENKLLSHNDDTDTNLYLIDIEDPSQINNIPIPFVLNTDWEDLASDDLYFYIGDFGNNVSGNRSDLRIFRIEKASLLSNPQVDTIHFSYETQTDFSPQNNNSTNFDCEAFLVTTNKIYLFTKEWQTNTTSLFELNKEPGTHTAVLKDSLDCQGLITGATHLEHEKLVVLCGYNHLLQPFIYLLYDFDGNNFFGGNKRKISLNLPFHQIEAIATANGLQYYLSNERFQSGNLTVDAKLHVLDLSNYLTTYLSNNELALPTCEFKSAITVYPNPATSELHIQIHVSESNQLATLEITDLYGKTLVKEPYTFSENKIRLSSHNLNSGWYILIGKDSQDQVLFTRQFQFSN